MTSARMCYFIVQVVRKLIEAGCDLDKQRAGSGIELHLHLHQSDLLWMIHSRNHE